MPRGKATTAQQQWNRGLVGQAPPPRLVERPGSCTAPACGTAADGRPPAGTVRVEVAGSREPARWYCPGFCAAYGQALAELRPVEDGPASP
ncbi:hypothetical protein [Streptomyces sp. DH37]|uniref:hypothetical protein n=1 Tax=Streptomyces sp. DH37 TaxID=3040122 RepID=UPI0024417FD8|nr:hypothetical protein [Streptomyces sp. DH37]MDG9703745.1 hypothetical protein [Streptomyces sp. DH37]